jgi:hypothetical protein
MADVRLIIGGDTKSVSKRSFRRPIARGEKVEGEWNYKNGRVPSFGRHRLLVRAWYTLQSGGSFAIGHSRQSVLVRR